MSLKKIASFENDPISILFQNDFALVLNECGVDAYAMKGAETLSKAASLSHVLSIGNYAPSIGLINENGSEAENEFYVFDRGSILIGCITRKNQSLGLLKLAEVHLLSNLEHLVNIRGNFFMGIDKAHVIHMLAISRTLSSIIGFAPQSVVKEVNFGFLKFKSKHLKDFSKSIAVIKTHVKKNSFNDISHQIAFASGVELINLTPRGYTSYCKLYQKDFDYLRVFWLLSHLYTKNIRTCYGLPDDEVLRKTEVK